MIRIIETNTCQKDFRYQQFLSFLFFGLFFLAIFLFSPKAVFAQNLLRNSGFESIDNSWSINHSRVGFTYSSDFYRSGSRAARVTNTSNSSYGIEQIILGIEPGEKYSFSGYAHSNDTNTSSIRLRLAWYESSDGSGSQISTIDSNIVNSPAYEWKSLAGNANAPQTAHSAKLRAVLASKTVDLEALAYFDDLIFEKLTSSTPTLSPTPTLTPSPIFTPAPASSSLVATYKINEAKDEEGNVLSSVKIYVDGTYVHHYAPETLTFCEGCKCDTYVDCGFGSHTITLEKSGYQNWGETTALSSGDSYEVNPIMNPVSSDSSNTKTSAPTVAAKSSSSLAGGSATPKETGRSSPSQNLPGEILGEGATLSSEATNSLALLASLSPAPTSVATPATGGPKKITKILLILGGISLLVCSIILLWRKKELLFSRFGSP